MKFLQKLVSSSSVFVWQWIKKINDKKSIKTKQNKKPILPANLPLELLNKKRTFHAMRNSYILLIEPTVSLCFVSKTAVCVWKNHLKHRFFCCSLSTERTVTPRVQICSGSGLVYFSIRFWLFGLFVFYGYGHTPIDTSVHCVSCIDNVMKQRRWDKETFFVICFSSAF